MGELELDHEKHEVIVLDGMDGNVCLFHSGFDARITGVCNKIAEKEKLTDVKIEGIERAIEAARREMDRRLEGMNEFRAQLFSQANTFYSKGEHEVYKEQITARLNGIEKTLFYKEGATRWSSHIITVLIAFAIFIIGQLIFKF